MHNMIYAYIHFGSNNMIDHLIEFALELGSMLVIIVIHDINIVIHDISQQYGIKVFYIMDSIKSGTIPWAKLLSIKLV